MTLDNFSSALTEERRARIEEVLNWRTYHVAVTLEDLYQSQNASAAIRTCECFGVQRIFTIENRNPLTLNKDVVVGSTKWVDIERFSNPDEDNTARCIERLSALGYRVIATTPHKSAKDVRNLDISSPFALLFGTELDGLTENALEMANDRVRLPMFGFTKSYNISVSVALVLSELVQRLHQSGANWQLDEAERKELRQRWYEAQVER